ncbi:MAG: hypothetical protein ACM3TU_00035 [Bacillota bacterium]
MRNERDYIAALVARGFCQLTNDEDSLPWVQLLGWVIESDCAVYAHYRQPAYTLVMLPNQAIWVHTEVVDFSDIPLTFRSVTHTVMFLDHIKKTSLEPRIPRAGRVYDRVYIRE